MRVHVFGTYDVAVHPRVGILAEGLRRHGFDVVECNVTLGLDTASRVAMLRQPWRLPRLLIRLLCCWVQLARMSRRLPAPDVVLVGYLGHFDVHLARCLYRRVPIVLDHLIGASDTARDRGEANQAKLRLLTWLDSAALRAARVVVVDTAEHLEQLPERFHAKTVIAPVGADDAWFDAARVAAPHERPADEPLKVVFFGLYTPLQGTAIIGEALALLTDAPVQATMIGSGQDLATAQLAAAPNPHVKWLPWVPHRELPAVVAAHDVCLGIFAAGPKAVRVVPNKVFEGAAAGCAIVTSDTTPQRRALDGAALLVPPGDPVALAGALRRLAEDRHELNQLRAAAAKCAQDRFTADRVVTPLVTHLRAHLALEGSQ